MSLQVRLVEDFLHLLREQAPACASAGEIALFLAPPLDQRLAQLRAEYQQRIDSIATTYTLSQPGGKLLQDSLAWALGQARDEAIAEAGNVCYYEAEPQLPAERESWLEGEFAVLIDEAEWFVKEEMEGFLEHTNLVDLGIIILGAGLVGLATAAVASHAIALIPGALATAEATGRKVAEQIPKTVRWFNSKAIEEAQATIRSAFGLRLEVKFPPDVVAYISTLPADIQRKLVGSAEQAIRAAYTLRDIKAAALTATRVARNIKTAEATQEAARLSEEILVEVERYQAAMNRLVRYAARHLKDYKSFRAELLRMAQSAKSLRMGLKRAIGEFTHAAGEWDTYGTSATFRLYVNRRFHDLSKSLRRFAVGGLSADLARRIVDEHPDLSEENVESVVAGYENEIEQTLEERVTLDIESLPLSEIGIEPPPGFPLELRTVGDLASLPEYVEI